MDFVFSFLKTISAMSIVLTALWFLVPKGATLNHFKYAMGVFAIWIFISTFKVAVKTYDNKITIPNTDSVVTNAESISRETAKFVLEELLYKCNIEFSQIDIIMDNSDSSDINITKAKIDFVNQDDFEVAKEIIKNQTGIILIR